MDKCSVDSKIKKMIKYILIILAIYMVVGGWLVSDGLYFDKSKTYSLLKDALAFALALLAPFTAIILYQDWRAEHRMKNNENLSKEIKTLFLQFMPLIDRYPNPTMTYKDFEQHQRNFYELKFKIKSQLEVVSAHDELSTSYKNKVQKALKKMDSYWIKFVELRQCLNQREDFINSQKKNDDTLKMLNDNVFNCEKEKGEVSSWLIRCIDNLEILAV